MLLAPPCQDRIMLRKWASGLQEEQLSMMSMMSTMSTMMMMMMMMMMVMMNITST